MKSLIITLALFLAHTASAETIYCIAGEADATGKMKYLTQSAYQFVVLKDDMSISVYRVNPKLVSAQLKNISQYISALNINKQLSTKKLVQVGVTGSYTITEGIAKAEYVLSENVEKKVKRTVGFSADLNALTAAMEISSFKNDKWAGTNSEKFTCSKAGLK